MRSERTPKDKEPLTGYDLYVTFRGHQMIYRSAGFGAHGLGVERKRALKETLINSKIATGAHRN